jgi:hypothetical protein
MPRLALKQQGVNPSLSRALRCSTLEISTEPISFTFELES